MYNLVAIGDPIIDTHVQIADNSAACEVLPSGIAHLCFEYAKKIPIVDSFQDLGGNAPNVAVGGSKLGLTTAVVATVGDDATGAMAREQLTKLNVDTGFISTDKTTKTRYSIVLNYKSERTILSYSDKKNYFWPEKFPETQWIYYTGLSEGFENIQNKLLEHLTKNPETRLAVNPGSYVLKYALSTFKEAVAKADVLIVNLEEAEMLTGKKLASLKSHDSLIQALVAVGAKEIVLTDGKNGAWAGTATETWYMPVFPVKPIAKTGAGDAFSSAYIAARNARHDIPHALLWGTASSTSVIQFHGPHQGLLDKKGVEKMITQYKKIVPQKIN